MIVVISFVPGNPAAQAKREYVGRPGSSRRGNRAAARDTILRALAGAAAHLGGGARLRCPLYLSSAALPGDVPDCLDASACSTRHITRNACSTARLASISNSPSRLGSQGRATPAPAVSDESIPCIAAIA